MLPTELDVFIAPCVHTYVIVRADHEAAVRTHCGIVCQYCQRTYPLHLGGSRAD